MAVTLSEIRRVPPLRSYNFEFVIPSWPGGGNGDLLRIPVLTTSLPGFSSEPVETMIAGFTEKFAGRGMFPRTLAVEYRETNNLDVWTALYNWNQTTFNSISGFQGTDEIGGGLINYKTTGFLRLFAENKNLVRSIGFEGIWPEDVGDSPLDGSSSDVVRVSVSFSYDRIFV